MFWKEILYEFIIRVKEENALKFMLFFLEKNFVFLFRILFYFFKVFL